MGRGGGWLEQQGGGGSRLIETNGEKIRGNSGERVKEKTVGGKVEFHTTSMIVTDLFSLFKLTIPRAGKRRWLHPHTHTHTHRHVHTHTGYVNKDRYVKSNTFVLGRHPP